MKCSQPGFFAFSNNIHQQVDNGGIQSDTAFFDIAQGFSSTLGIPVWLDDADTRHSEQEISYTQYYIFNPKQWKANRKRKAEAKAKAAAEAALRDSIQRISNDSISLQPSDSLKISSDSIPTQNIDSLKISSPDSLSINPGDKEKSNPKDPRSAGKNNKVPMCGIPFHAADNYISRLLKQGKKVSICEQNHQDQ